MEDFCYHNVPDKASKVLDDALVPQVEGLH